MTAPGEMKRSARDFAIKTIYLTDERATCVLQKKYRTMFRLADRFQTAREAHRIFVMRLGAR